VLSGLLVNFSMGRAASHSRCPGLISSKPDGVMAVTKVNNAPEYFDLIFMDIVMPGLDGASATDLIRQAAPTIPVIAMTSNIKPEDVQWYAEHGMSCCCLVASRARLRWMDADTVGHDI
jgi:CheY-like chemotaxis protein